MRRSALTATVAFTAAAATLGSAAPAFAEPKPVVDVRGQGTFVLDALGAAVITGPATGKPFDGTYTARLAAADGTLPAPGECEPGTATLRVDDPRDRSYALTSSDDICGEFLQPPFVVTHVFTGRYDVAASTKRRLLGTDGFLEVRLATDGRASVFAIDT